MSTPAIKLEKVLHRRSTSQYCGYRKLGIALDAKRNQLHHALVHDAGMACVDIETGQTISSIAMPDTCGAKDCSYSAHADVCCCAAGRSILCFDVRQPIIAMQAHNIGSAMSAISCSNDGRYVAYASPDSSVGLFSLRMNCVVRPGLFHTSCVNSCHFDEDCTGFWTAVGIDYSCYYSSLSLAFRDPTKWSVNSRRPQAPVSSISKITQILFWHASQPLMAPWLQVEQQITWWVFLALHLHLGPHFF